MPMPRMKIEYRPNEAGEFQAFVTVWEGEEETPTVEAVMEPKAVTESPLQAEELIEQAGNE